MLKNQSIKSFFTSTQTNSKSSNEEVTKKSEEIIDLDKEESKTKKTPEKHQVKKIQSKTPKSESKSKSKLAEEKEKTNKRQRKASLSPSVEKKNDKKKSLKNKKNDEHDDDIIIEEKENNPSESTVSDTKSNLVEMNELEEAKWESSSDTEDSPIKKSLNSSKNSKKRKLIIESSSSEEMEKNESKSKSSPTKKKETQAKLFSKTKDKEKSNSPKKESKKINDSPKEEKKEIKLKTDEVKEKDSNKSDEKVKTKDEVKEKDSNKSDEKVKTKEAAVTTFSKSTSNFFGGKKAESTTSSNKESKTGSDKTSYLPNKENYHPIEDACWSKNEPVPYKALSQTLYTMEQTTKRLELLSIVCNYFRSVLALTPKDLIPSMYILTNKVAPDYDSLELGIGDTVLFKALAEATGCTVAKLKLEFQNKGDIGLVAEANRCNQKLIFTPKKLTISTVFGKLRDIASITGNSSQSKKCDLIKSLLVSCDPIEARYLMRSLAGKLRNGLGEQSILSACAHACVTTPPLLPQNINDDIIVDKFEKLRKSGKIDEIKEELEKAVRIVKHAYHQCPNYERVINSIITYGLENLEEHCKLTPGVPLKPMLAYPTKGVQEILKRFDQIEFTCEYKYDGERAQIHILDDGSVQVYSRNSENNTTKYPDVIETLKSILNLKKEKKENDDEAKQVRSAILDAEIVAYDSENNIILPFQILSTRKRKDANASEIKIQVCIFAFDLLYINGKSIIDESFRKRREYLYEYFPLTQAKLMFAQYMNSSDLEKIQEFLEKSVKDGCEGLMVKTLDTDAHYEISKRSHNWLKLKKDYLDGVGDTLDLVVIGGYLGTGKRTGVYGGYLLACYDQENEEYQTVCKIGTGFKDDDLQKQFESLTKIKIDKPKAYYRVNDSVEQPDHWFEPEQVWEIKCADFSLSPVHTAAIGMLDQGKGISMRFPRYLKTREDKKPEDATSSEQIVEMYKNQQQQLNQNEKPKTKKTSDDEEEDEDDLENDK